MPDKTRSSVMATFTASVAQYFCPEIIDRLFGQQTTVTPDAISPTAKLSSLTCLSRLYGATGRFAGIVWKYCAQLAFERRTRARNDRFSSSLTRATISSRTLISSSRPQRGPAGVASFISLRALSNYYALSPGNSAASTALIHSATA
jgi:hypothetical protein